MPTNAGGAPPFVGTLYGRAGLREFLDSRGLRLTKALGQNFLVRRETIRAMLDAARLPSGGRVLEIGPGVGHLTWALLERGLSVTAVEMDRAFVRALGELDGLRTAGNPGLPELSVVEADAAAIDLAALARERGISHAIGNLPYNASVPILMKLAFAEPPLNAFYATIQKEVGDRLLAPPGGKDYGRLSIVPNYLCGIRKLRELGPGAFYPPPRVDSVFLEFVPKPAADRELARTYLERLVKLGFAHRRKKLRSQLRGAIVERRSLGGAFWDELERSFNFDQRAEEWPVGEWLRLCERVRAQPPEC